MGKQVTLEMVLSMKDQSRTVLKGMGVDVADLGNKMAQTALKIENLADKYALQARSASVLEQKLATLRGAENQDETAIEQLSIRYDSLTQRMAQTTQQAGILSARLQEQAKVASTIKPPDMAMPKGGSGGSGGLGGMAGMLPQLAAGYLSLGTAVEKFKSSYDLVGTLDQSRKSLGNLMGDITKGNQVINDAIAFGQKFGFTQKDMATAAADAADIFKRTTQSNEKSFEVLGRLASRNPTEGFKGAAFSVNELMSGDVTSIVERFRLSRDAAYELRDAIRDGADPIQKLDEVLNRMGVTSSVLAQRMEGPAGAANKLALASENVDVAIGNFLVKIGAPEALEIFANGLNTIAGAFSSIDEAAGATDTMNLGQSFNEYNQQVEQTNIKNKVAAANLQIVSNQMGGMGGIINGLASGYQLFNQQSDRLNEQQYKLAQALIQSGASADQAANAARNLAPALNEAWGGLIKLVSQGDITRETMSNIEAEMVRLGTSSPETANQVALLAEQLANGDISAQQLQDGLDGLVAVQENAQAATNALAAMQAFQAEQTQLQTEATNEYAGALEYAIIAQENGTVSLSGMTDEQLKSTNAFAEQALMAEINRQRMELLNEAVYNVAGGQSSLSEMSAYLSQKLGINKVQAENLINTYLRLYMVLARGRGTSFAKGIDLKDTMQGAIDNAVQQAGDLGDQLGEAIAGSVRVGVIEAGAAPKKKKKGGSGKKAGKSEAEKEAEKEQKALDKLRDKALDAQEKFEDKAEDLQRDHVSTLIKINLDYYKKALAAEQKFNTDKFNARVGFAKGIVDVDQDLWDKANAEEVGYWDKSQAIAQAGDATRAAAYLEAGQKLAQMKAEQAQELRNLDQQIADEEDAAEAARLQQRRDRLAKIYEDEQRLAGENLQKIEQGQDELKKERDEAIAKENSDYNEAVKKNQDSFMEAVGKMVEDSGDLTTAASDMVNALIPLYAQLVKSAQDAASAAAAIGAPASVVNAPQLDGSHALGLNRVPRDGYIAELHAGERVLTAAQARAQDRLAQMGRVMQPTERGMFPVGDPMRSTMPMGNPSSRAGTNQTNTTNDNRVVNIYTNNADRILRIIDGQTDAKINRFSQRSGRKAINKGKV